MNFLIHDKCGAFEARISELEKLLGEIKYQAQFNDYAETNLTLKIINEMLKDVKVVMPVRNK